MIKIGKKVLIVDDSRFMRSILKNIVKKFDVTIIEAEDSKTAVQKFNLEKPDLVLMDVILPDNNGINTLKQMPEVTAIIITSMGQDAIKEDAKKIGINDYIVKPFDAEAVIAILKKYLD